MDILGKKKGKKSGSEDAAPSSEGVQTSGSGDDKAPEPKPSKKKSGSYYEVRSATGRPYRKAGYGFGIEIQKIYVADLSEAQCKMFDEANPKALVVRLVEG